MSKEASPSSGKEETVYVSEESPYQVSKEASPSKGLTLDQLERIALSRAKALELKRKRDAETKTCQEICDGKVCGNTDIDAMLSESFQEYIW